MSGNEKQPLVPRLRFPEFRGAPEWGRNKLEELITSVSPPSKLQSSSYGTQGKFPIIDQSQELICGWTDDERAVITESLPLIIFGDHTCALKFVDEPFAQGADGIKILKARPAISAEYLFHSLSHRPLAMEDYKRHFSMLKERAVVFPDIESGEQQKIADCLSSLDDLIAAENQKLDTLKTHKKGLMQQLFPREGETAPRLRFPEFRSASAWSKVSAGKMFSNRIERGKSGLPIYSVTMTDGLVPRSSLDRKIDDIAETAANKTVRAGDLAYNMMRMWQGALGVAPQDCMVSPAYIVLEPQGVNPFFFYFLLKLPQSLRVLTAHSRGLTEDRLRLYYDDFAKVSLQCPSRPEQDRIADCLISVDNIIAVQSQNIDALKTHKKGLMQQLFPVLDEVPA